MSTLIYLDDIRTPDMYAYGCDMDKFVVCRDRPSFEAAINQMLAGDVSSYHVSFDHDLGQPYNGVDLIRWMCEQFIEKKISYESLPGISFHTANPIGAENMHSVLCSYLKVAFNT